jgi:hypothetical protein
VDALGFAGQCSRNRQPTATAGYETVLAANRTDETASNDLMLAGKRCSPALIYIFIAIIVGSLAFFAFHHGPQRQPPAEPIHEKQ